MRLVVETGQGIPGANSYIDIADVEQQLPSGQLSKWNELSADERIDRLIAASLFIDSAFNWAGRRRTLEQGLSWPRTGIAFQGHRVPDDSIPLQIKRATVMAMGLIMSEGLDIFRQTGEAQVKREKIGPMETEYFEALKVQFEYSSEYSDINNILRGFFVRPGGVMTAKVERA